MEDLEEVDENPDEKEEIIEPQITSLDPNERKLARRLRIQRRQERIWKQQHLGIDDLEGVDKRTLLEKQLDNSENQLEKLLHEGRELVTNVRIANDAREVKRRADEVAAREKRLQRLEDQANESLEKYNEVTSKWKVILVSNDPLDLHHDIEEQKVKCAELVIQKDLLIKELKKELKLSDERFDMDQKKQRKDQWLLAERIDNQVKVMRKAYKEELKLIEQVIELERKHLMKVNNKKWKVLYREREKLEVQQMKKKFEAVEEHEDEMYIVTLEHHEKFREVKIKLETDIQVLQQELEHVKAQCLLNNEKLVYNFQVLKKREEENLIVRAHQKRKINRLQDVANDLKRDITETKKSTITETARLTEEVVKLHNHIIDIEKKGDHLAEVNDRKYQQVWKLNKETATKLLEKVLDVDRILHEQQLGLEWVRPDLSLLHQEDLASYQSALQIVAELFRDKGSFGVKSRIKPFKWPVTKEEVKKLYVKEKLLRSIIELVAKNSDFLVEKQLKELLEPHTDEENMLIKIDNIFSALGVKTEAEMMMLKQCFLPYAKCTVCIDGPEEREITTMFPSSHDSFGSTSTAGDTETAEMGMIIGTSSMKFFVDPTSEQQLLDLDMTIASESMSTPVKSFSTIKAKLNLTEDKDRCSESHPLVIDPAFVLKGLRDFVSKYAPERLRPIANLTSSLSVKRSTVSRLLSTQDVTTFWTRFREIFSPQREKLWDGLLLGLQRYHSVLEDRHKLNMETEQLRKQNAELRKLLHFYIQSPENEAFLSSGEYLPPISRDVLKRKSKLKFMKAVTNGRKSM